MTITGLPEVKLRCPSGHQFATTAAAGKAPRCPTCGRSKRVPVGRPTTARAAKRWQWNYDRAYQQSLSASADDDQEDDQDPELTARWNSEVPWSGDIEDRAGGPGEDCEDCSGALSWDARGTMICCPVCDYVDVAPSIAEHYARESSNSTEVAISERVNPIDEIAAQARLTGLIIHTENEIEAGIRKYGDPDSYDLIQWKRAALGFAATMRGWLPAIKNAQSESQLDQIRERIVNEVLDSESGKALRAEYRAARDRANQRELWQQNAEEIQQAEEEGQRQQSIIQATPEPVRQGATPLAVTSGQVPGILLGSPIAQLGLEINRWQLRRDDAIKQRGACEFKHHIGTAADRLYCVPQRDFNGNDTGYAIASAPQMRACPKHYAALEAEMARQGYTDIVWRDLHAS